MGDQKIATDSSWVPDACTLPTAELPLRLAEFDQLFRRAVCGVDRLSAQHLRLRLVGTAQVEEQTRSLTTRESSCCGFFAFHLFRSDPDALILDVRVPAAHVGVLDGLARRAAAAATG